jgi:hypothetical protein
MGHIRLGEMPRTGYWRDVIKTLDLSDDPARIANVTAKAARQALEAAGRDDGISDVVYMLMKFVWSSSPKKDFRKELKDIGISTAEKDVTLLDLISGLSDALDRRLRQRGHRSDLAEIARMSVVDTLMDICRHQTGSLFGATVKETQEALRKNTAPERFAAIGQRFFGKFLYRFLDYHLSRELPGHIGVGRRYETISDCDAFKTSLARYAIETSRIAREFTGYWASATEFKEGISPKNVREKFVPIAFKKLLNELQRRDAL